MDNQAPRRQNCRQEILLAERLVLPSFTAQLVLVGSGKFVTVVVDTTRLVTAPAGPVVVLVALDSSGLVWSVTR
jgi:hypothetical protein